MMSSFIGALALVLCFFYSEETWVQRSFDFFSTAFLWAFFISVIVGAVKCFMKSTYAAVAEAKSYGIRSFPIAFLGILLLVLPDFSVQEWRAGILFILFFVWIDALKYDLNAIRYNMSFEGASETLKKAMKQAIKSKDLNKTLSEFESVILLSEKTFKEHDSLDVQKSVQFIISTVDEILLALPQMTLPSGEKEIESLLDRYVLFQAVVSKKMEGIITYVRNEPSEFKWDLLIKLLTKMTILFGSVYENFGGPFFLTMGDSALYLQSIHSTKEMDAYAGCVEAIKALLDHSLQKKKDAQPIVTPLLNKLEFFMKERFRKDRTINAAMLMQPFAEIGEFLSQQAFLSLNGREELLGDLKRILSQFAILETISERMGETGQTDTEASYHEDLPFLKGKKGERAEHDEIV